MQWLANLLNKKRVQTQSNQVFKKTESVVTGKDSSSVEVHKQKNQFASDLLNLEFRTKMLTEKANSTTYYMAQAMGTLKVA